MTIMEMKGEARKNGRGIKHSSDVGVAEGERKKEGRKEMDGKGSTGNRKAV